MVVLVSVPVELVSVLVVSVLLVPLVSVPVVLVVSSNILLYLITEESAAKWF